MKSLIVLLLVISMFPTYAKDPTGPSLKALSNYPEVKKYYKKVETKLNKNIGGKNTKILVFTTALFVGKKVDSKYLHIKFLKGAKRPRFLYDLDHKEINCFVSWTFR